MIWTKNFSRKEFACPDKCGFDDISLDLVRMLQKIRDAAGQPVSISSGCRCKVHNKRVGGVANSSHLAGKAANIYVKGWSNNTLGALIRKLYNEGKLPLLCYTYKITGKTNTGVHIDIDRTKNRKNKFGTGY